VALHNYSILWKKYNVVKGTAEEYSTISIARSIRVRAAAIRPGPDLSPEERAEVKKVARYLLERVRSVLVLNSRQKAQARAQVKLTIEDTLDEGATALLHA
jgi:hypothetical protein